MRKTYEYGSTGSAVLEPQENTPARPKAAAGIRRAVSDPLRPSRTLADSYAEDPDTEAFLRASGRSRRIRRGLSIPKTRSGRIAAGVGVLVALIGLTAAGLAAKHYLITSDKFRIPSSAAIEIDGNTHLTRSQMLSVFGEDVERNIFKVPMNERRAQLEAMPWVDHATVMRLLPNRIRVHITERVPVAFVRQGGTIGMVDASGVLLDIPPDAPGNPSYSFPVITGLKADDPLAARAQRMKLYSAFLRDLDSEGKGISTQLSEVDLSDSEDVKALIPDHNNEVLVHFGSEGFLSRYKKFEDHIGEWRQQYPRLSSVDMRYERQVVLQMPPKDSTVVGGQQAPQVAVSKVPEATAVSASAKAVPAQKAVLPVAPAKLVAVAKPAPRPVEIAKKPASTAAQHNAAVHLAKGSAKPTAKEIAMQKRVTAIKAWMAKRKQSREEQSAKATGAAATP